MKHQTLFALAATVTLMAISATASAATYMDTHHHWASKQINALAESNIFVGYGDQTFRPYNTITRSEFVSTLMKALGASGNTTMANYKDLQSMDWTTPYVNQADSKDLIEGYGRDDFKPNKPISRGEALAILSKVTLGQNLPQEKVDLILKNYRDAYRIPTWNREAVAKAINYDIFRSTAKNANYVQPVSKITRGEAAHMIYTLLQHNEIARQPEIEVFHKWAKVMPDQTIQFPQGLDRRRTKSTYTTTVATPVSSEFTHMGDSVTLVLNEALTTSNGITIEPGSKIFGLVKEILPASWNQTAAVNIDFDQVLTPSGKLYDLKGTIATTDGFLRGNNNPAKKTPESSYDALKAMIKYESGAHSRHQKESVFYQNPYTTDSSANSFVDENQTNFVLVGVGDQLELNFTGPASLKN